MAEGPRVTILAAEVGLPVTSIVLQTPMLVAATVRDIEIIGTSLKAGEENRSCERDPIRGHSLPKAQAIDLAK